MNSADDSLSNPWLLYNIQYPQNSATNNIKEKQFEGVLTKHIGICLGSYHSERKYRFAKTVAVYKCKHAQVNMYTHMHSYTHIQSYPNKHTCQHKNICAHDSEIHKKVKTYFWLLIIWISITKYHSCKTMYMTEKVFQKNSIMKMVPRPMIWVKIHIYKCFKLSFGILLPSFKFWVILTHFTSVTDDFLEITNTGNNLIFFLKSRLLTAKGTVAHMHMHPKCS